MQNGAYWTESKSRDFSLRFDWPQAFVDFEGCCALTCGVERCRAAFCFFCLADCGTDAHGHVVKCPKNLNPGQLFTKKNLHDVAHRESRKKQIVNYLQTKCRDTVLRSKVLESIAKNLAELQIEITPQEVGLKHAESYGGDIDQTAPVIRNQVERHVPAPDPRPVPVFGVNPAPPPRARPVPAVGLNPVPAPLARPVPAPLVRPVPAPIARPVPAPAVRPVEDKKKGCCIS
jgi:hypothetical protein